MNPSQRSDTMESSVDLSGVLRRRWLIIVVLAVVGLVGAFGYVTVAPKAYTATSAVYVAPTGADQNQPGSTSSNKANTGLVNMNTEATIVTSGTVASTAIRILKSSLTPYQLTKQISVVIPPSSQVLEINCTASSPASSVTCANAFATAYLADRRSNAQNVLSGQIAQLQNSVKGVQNRISALNAAISGLPASSPTRANDLTDIASDKTEISSLNAQISTLTGQAANVTGGRVLTQATPPGSPSSPKKSYIIPAGLVAGLLIGLIAAFVADRRDRRLHSANDVERLLDIPVLLDLSRNTFGRQVSLAAPRSRMGKAFTELAHAVASSLGEGSHVLLVAGTSPGPEASVVAANLAATLARTHSEAVLVCADMRDSVATEMFGLTDNRGLAEVVAGRATVGEVARGPAGIPGLWVIPPGADTSLAEYHLQYDTAKALTAQLRRDARYVVIEAQAGDDGADTFALSEFADAALLTVEVNRTSREEAGNAITRLHRMRTPIVGAAALPTLGRISVRPPQPVGGQPRLGSDGRDGAVGGHSYGELPGSQDRPVRSRETHGDPADRVPGR
ncbi:MAG TPA: Wzz/FepE/Etk N-terminal domain-containing protein [Streptosporangiaceae bacterium]|nr:Wzz/FepE/Etk N-terminal domain-containing protein [Streptosporangiaceae bacterium]